MDDFRAIAQPIQPAEGSFSLPLATTSTTVAESVDMAFLQIEGVQGPSALDHPRPKSAAGSPGFVSTAIPRKCRHNHLRYAALRAVGLSARKRGPAARAFLPDVAHDDRRSGYRLCAYLLVADVEFHSRSWDRTGLERRDEGCVADASHKGSQNYPELDLC